MVPCPKYLPPDTPKSPEGKQHKRVSAATVAIFGEKLSDGGQPRVDLDWFFGATLTADGSGVIKPRRAGEPPGDQQSAILSEFDQPEGRRSDKLAPLLKNAALSQGVGFEESRSEESQIDDARLRLISTYKLYLDSIFYRKKHAEEEAMMKSLCVIDEELRKWELSLNLDPVYLRLASYWDEEAQPPVSPPPKRRSAARRKRKPQGGL